MILTRLLEEVPGVRSTARLVAVVLTVLTAIIVLTGCLIAIYSLVHAKDHEEHAATVISSAGSLITQLTLLLAPVIGGIWVALGLRKKTGEDSTVTTTQVTTTGPSSAPPVVSVAPATPANGP